MTGRPVIHDRTSADGRRRVDTAKQPGLVAVCVHASWCSFYGRSRGRSGDREKGIRLPMSVVKRSSSDRGLACLLGLARLCVCAVVAGSVLSRQFDAPARSRTSTLDRPPGPACSPRRVPMMTRCSLYAHPRNSPSPDPKPDLSDLAAPNAESKQPHGVQHTSNVPLETYRYRVGTVSRVCPGSPAVFTAAS